MTRSAAAVRISDRQWPPLDIRQQRQISKARQICDRVRTFRRYVDSSPWTRSLRGPRAPEPCPNRRCHSRCGEPRCAGLTAELRADLASKTNCKSAIAGLATAQPVYLGQQRQSLKRRAQAVSSSPSFTMRWYGSRSLLMRYWSSPSRSGS
jgi:hypothetical protein